MCADPLKTKKELNNQFKLELEGGSRSVSYYNNKNEIKFDPPVYEQRYCVTNRVLEHDLWKGQFKKVVEFGCAEMRYFTILKTLAGLEHVLQIDIDDELLRIYKDRTKPLLVDYLKPRGQPLKVDIYKGSIDTAADCLKNTDAVIGIEIIEHLYPDVLEGVPFNIFGVIKPKLAIFTTPNSECNVLFQLNLPNGFRHYDHKFEWSRKQFKDWSFNICNRFPNYKVAFLGVGNVPPEKKQLGHVSQMAVFIRKDLIGIKLPETLETPSDAEIKNEAYELLHSEEFPFNVDTRSNNEKILDEAKYHIGRYLSSQKYFSGSSLKHEIPLHILYDFVRPMVFTITELSTVLSRNGYLIEREHVIIEPENDYDEFTEEGYFHDMPEDHNKEDVEGFNDEDVGGFSDHEDWG